MLLGCLEHDPVALAAAPAHRFGAIPPPTKLDRSLSDFGPEMYDNNNFGDCTAVALANCARGVAHLNGYELVVAPKKPLQFFSECVGNPPDLATSLGAVALDVLKRQATQGFDIGPQRLYGQWGTINIKSRTALARAITKLGPIYISATLREREMNTIDQWDIKAGRDDGAEIGRHMMPVWCFAGLADDDAVVVGTWGRWQSVSWAWLMARLNEAHGLVWKQLERANGFYFGVPPDGLISEL